MSTNILRLNSFPAKVFTYKPNGRTFIAEASTLQDKFLLPIYTDAADVGLTIEGRRHKVTYSLDRVDQGPDGIRAWHFLPIPEDRKISGATKVVIFND